VQFVEDASVDVVLQKSTEHPDGSARRMIDLKRGPYDARPRRIEVKRAFPKIAGHGLGSTAHPQFGGTTTAGPQQETGFGAPNPWPPYDYIGAIYAAQARPKPTCCPGPNVSRRNMSSCYN
jgi:hypothetical protein